MAEYLALDLATSTGFAFTDGEKIRSGSFRLPKTGKDVGSYLVAFERHLTDVLMLTKPTHLVFEAPILHAGQTSIDTARKLMNLAGFTEYMAKRHCISHVTEANNLTVRKHFLGSARGKRDVLKAKTIEACRARGWSPENDDEADGLALLDYALHCFRDPRATTGPLFGKGAAA